METPTRSAQRMPMSFRAHRQHIAPCDAFDDSDGLASPTARKSGAPRTPSLPSSPASSSPAPAQRPAFGRRLTFEHTVGLSDYEDETDAEVERTADGGICAIMFTGTNVLNNGRSPFKTPVVNSGATSARRRSSVKRRLTDSGGNIQLGPKKVKVQPNTPVESAATNMLLKQTNSMRRLSLRDDNHDPRRPRKISGSAVKTAPLRRTISIFESSNATPVAPHFSPFSSQPTPVIARPNFHHQREPSQGTILFGGPSIFAAQVMPTTTFNTPAAARELHGDEPSSPSVGLFSSPTPQRRGPIFAAPPQPIVTVQPATDTLMDESPIKKKFRRSSAAASDLARLVVTPQLAQGSLVDGEPVMTPTSATVMTPTSATLGNFSPLAAETSWPMLASRERRDVAKQRRSSAAAHKVSPLKKPMPGTPVKRGGSAFARQWLSTSKLPDKTAAFASRKSLPLSFPNLAFASNTSTPSSKSGDSVEGDEEEGSPSLRPLARRQSGRQQPNTRASIGAEPIGGRRATTNFGAIPMLLSGEDTSSSSSEEDDEPRFARPLPPRRRHESSSDASDDEMGVGSPTHGLARVSATPSSRTTRVSVQTPCRSTFPATPSQTHGTALGLVGLGFTPSKSPSAHREATQTGETVVDPGRLERCYMDFAELGRGEFGCVLKARRRVDGLPCAIKRTKVFEGANHRLRVREEADILRRLSEVGRCVNVLEFHTAWEQDAQLHIETELCVYGSFAVFLSDYGSIRERLDEARVWKVVADVGEGLRFVHAAGFIHLDIKPANILVGDDARLRIADFGMASAWPPVSHDGSDASDFEREGDRVYMAPEVLQGVYGLAADVFSFGLVVLEAATNIVVPDSGDAWHKLRSEDFSGVDMSTLSEPLRRLIQATMCPRPEGRPTMEQVCAHPVVAKVRAAMDAVADLPGMAASPLHPEPDSFLEAVLRDCEDV